eukprot:gene303-364_t
MREALKLLSGADGASTAAATASTRYSAFQSRERVVLITFATQVQAPVWVRFEADKIDAARAELRQRADAMKADGGTAIYSALAAAEETGIDAEVINLRSLRPFDTETIVQSVKKTNRLVSCEEGWPFAGIGAELSALMMEHAFDYLDAPVKRVAGLDVPLPYAANLEKMALPQSTHIVEAARAVCNR